MVNFNLISCPNCGSTAQVRNIDSNVDKFQAEFEYKCGCGHHWVDIYKINTVQPIKDKERVQYE